MVVVDGALRKLSLMRRAVKTKGRVVLMKLASSAWKGGRARGMTEEEAGRRDGGRGYEEDVDKDCDLDDGDDYFVDETGEPVDPQVSFRQRGS